MFLISPSLYLITLIPPPFEQRGNGWEGGGELLLYTALLVAKVVENEVLLSSRLLHKDGSISGWQVEGGISLVEILSKTGINLLGFCSSLDVQGPGGCQFQSHCCGC
jgi:hypothetical protein